MYCMHFNVSRFIARPAWAIGVKKIASVIEEFKVNNADYSG